MSNFLKAILVLFLGVLGALIFNVFLMPYMLKNPYFDRFEFIRDLKQGKIVVREQVYLQENNSIRESIARIQKSVVAIQSQALGVRSGLIVTSDGLVIALANALPTKGSFSVFVAGEPVDAEVLKIDSKNNLALIKIRKSNLPIVGFADFDKLKLGQGVFLVSAVSAKQDNWIANEGIIRQIEPAIIKTNIIEDKDVSSSPLFNAAGELLGLSFIDKDGRISALPIYKIREFLGM